MKNLIDAAVEQTFPKNASDLRQRSIPSLTPNRTEANTMASTSATEVTINRPTSKRPTKMTMTEVAERQLVRHPEMATSLGCFLTWAKANNCEERARVIIRDHRRSLKDKLAACEADPFPELAYLALFHYQLDSGHNSRLCKVFWHTDTQRRVFDRLIDLTEAAQEQTINRKASPRRARSAFGQYKTTFRIELGVSFVDIPLDVQKISEVAETVGLPCRRYDGELNTDTAYTWLKLKEGEEVPVGAYQHGRKFYRIEHAPGTKRIGTRCDFLIPYLPDAEWYDSDEWLSLCRNCEERPKDVLRRLVASDWLEERGDIRFVLIRTDCQYTNKKFV